MELVLQPVKSTDLTDYADGSTLLASKPPLSSVPTILVVSVHPVKSRDFIFFFFKQKTAYEIKPRDWSSDVCSSDLPGRQAIFETRQRHRERTDLLLLFATYWQLGAKPLETAPALQQRQMGH